MKVLQTLFDTTQGRFKYAVKAWALALVPAIVLSIVLNLLFPQVEDPPLDGVMRSGFVTVILIVVLLGPLLETLMMWPVIALLSTFIKATWAIAVLSALLWAVFHSLQAPLWGAVIFWPFVVFSIAFTEWRKKSVWNAILVTFMIHGLQNFTAASLALVDPEFRNSGGEATVEAGSVP
jgi:hypothetical protein